VFGFCLVSVIARYSALVEDNATVGFKRLLQLIAPPMNLKTYPVVDLKVD
jgi:hypothetical protein